MRRLLLIALLPVALTACTDKQQQNADAAGEQVAGKLDAASEQFRTEANQAASDLDRRIAELETAAQNTTGEAREQYNETLNDLREKRTALQADLDRFATTTQDDFDDLRDDVADKQANLEADLDEASLKLAQTKEAFQTAAQRRMTALDRDIDRLQNDASNATGDAKVNADKALNDLREKRQRLGDKLDRVGAASEDQFADMRGDLAEGFAGLRRDIAGALDALATAVTPNP